jgi:hypothetical protein
MFSFVVLTLIMMTSILIEQNIALSSLVQPSSILHSFLWGINGHPISQPSYLDTSIPRQLNFVNDLGISWYRFDLPQSIFDSDKTRIDQLVNEASRQHINLLPVLMPYPISAQNQTATREQIRQESAAFAKNVVSRYKGKISCWELDNELEIYAALRKGEITRSGEVSAWGMTDGKTVDQFEENRYQKVKTEILGLEQGVMQADPSALTVVNAGWLHTGFMERLVKEDKIPFNVLAWHWYSEMGDITNVKDHGDLIQTLKQYQKPLILTEISYRAGSKDGKEKEQASYIREDIATLSRHRDIKGLFVYELFDEPYFGEDHELSHYGLIEVDRVHPGKWEVNRKKPAYKAYQNITTQRHRV